MKVLQQAIYTLFSAIPHNDLYNTITDLGFEEVPAKTAFPYGVFSFLSIRPEYTFNSTTEDVVAQFILFSDNNSSSELGDLYTYLRALFDDCILTVTGYSHVKMEWIFAYPQRDPDGEYWQYTVRYRVWIHQ